MEESLHSLKETFKLNLKASFSEREKEQMFFYLLDRLFDISKTQFYTSQADNTKLQNIEATLTEITERLNDGIPLQYITNHTQFLDLDLYVNKHVLIPRPETEELVMEASKVVASESSVLDIGTGSGCIALGIKQLNQGAQATGIDLSKTALEVAVKNAVQNSLAVHFTQASMEDDLTDLGMFDVIISNPPYIGIEEEKDLSEHVIQHEPKMALFSVNEDPLYFYKCILARTNEILQRGGFLFLEIHEKYAEETAAIFQNGGFQTVQILKDLQGKERMIRAQKS